MDNDALLAGLDEGQRAAVVQPSPVAVLAPAGSGKTRVLVRRVAYQTEVGALDPRRTLCVAFTREAAGELRQRLRALGMRDLPAAGTFHSIAYAQLRARWEDLGIGPKDLLTDRLSVLRRLLPARLTAAASGIDAEISWAKGRGLAPEEYLAAAREVRRRPPGGQPEAARQFAAYEKHRIASKRVDFDDLITLVTEAFETDPTFATGQRYRFRHLLLDEFQDVNAAQFRLLRAWLGPSKDVTVVGDPHQAIYGWTGADAGYLQRFEQQFPGAVTLRLGVNYRSSAAIAAVAAVLTSEPPPETNNDDGPLPQVRRFSTETTELAGIAEACRDDHASGIGWGDQAVLVRTNALAREIVEYLAGRDIPCRLLANRDATPLAAVIEELVRTAATFDDLLADLAEEATEPDASPQLARIADRAEEFAALDAWPNPRRFIDWLRTSGSLADGAGVTVATFHAAKGLEWQAVHVAALEDGFVPSAAAVSSAMSNASP